MGGVVHGLFTRTIEHFKGDDWEIIPLQLPVPMASFSAIEL